LGGPGGFFWIGGGVVDEIFILLYSSGYPIRLNFFKKDFRDGAELLILVKNLIKILKKHQILVLNIREIQNIENFPLN
jgi:hypothetical protein